jgi:hypothetical protein
MKLKTINLLAHYMNNPCPVVDISFEREPNNSAQTFIITIKISYVLCDALIGLLHVTFMHNVIWVQ